MAVIWGLTVAEWVRVIAGINLLLAGSGLVLYSPYQMEVLPLSNLETASKDSPLQVIDPVCGMSVEPDQTNLVSVHEGCSYWFCAEACRDAFQANPRKYLESKPAKKKGWFGRYLDRMAKVNEKEFGCADPKCH